jgi:heme-degrading monooxygenase HmoA
MSEVFSSGAWTAKEGEEDDFVEAWTEFARWLSEMPRSGTARRTRDLDQPRRYLSFAPWESVEAMHEWKNQPDFRDRIGAVRRHVTEFVPSELELVAEV